MDSEHFTEKEYDRIIDDVMNDFFDQHNINYDMKELVKTGMLGETEGINAITPNTNI